MKGGIDMKRDFIRIMIGNVVYACGYTIGYIQGFFKGLVESIFTD